MGTLISRSIILSRHGSNKAKRTKSLLNPALIQHSFLPVLIVIAFREILR